MEKIFRGRGDRSSSAFCVLFILKSIFIDKWQLMSEIGHHMFMVIDVALKLIIISFERRWDFEDRDFC